MGRKYSKPPSHHFNPCVALYEGKVLYSRATFLQEFGRDEGWDLLHHKWVRSLDSDSLGKVNQSLGGS